VVAECTKRYTIDKFLDVDEFIRRTLVRPTEVLSEYLHRLIQVNVIMPILSWDPDLAYLQNNILSGKILHIDSNVLFSLMQTTHPQHQFLSNLLRATRNDLGVQLLVHEKTISEYHQPIEWANEQFDHYRSRLRDVAETCKRHNERPADYLEESVFADYVSNNLDHIDQGTCRNI